MKETVSKVKRQPSEWGKIIVNETTDKELISKIYKQFILFNTRKINEPIKTWAKELIRHLSKEDIQMAFYFSIKIWMKVFLGRVFLVVGSSFSSLRVCCIIPFWFVDFLLRNQLIMLWEFPCVCLFFPLVAFNNLSLSLIFVTLITVCLGMFFLGFILTGPLSVS